MHSLSVSTQGLVSKRKIALDQTTLMVLSWFMKFYNLSPGFNFEWSWQKERLWPSPTLPKSWYRSKNGSRVIVNGSWSHGMVAWVAGRLRGSRQVLAGRGLNEWSSFLVSKFEIIIVSTLRDEGDCCLSIHDLASKIYNRGILQSHSLEQNYCYRGWTPRPSIQGWGWCIIITYTWRSNI